MKAYQRRIRDELAQSEGATDLFGEWWRDVDVSIDRAIIRPVTYTTARNLILKYEWLGTMPAVVLYTFGIFFGGHCGGIVCYGPEYGENLGIWDRYGFTGKIIVLSRGACAHWAHPHAGSKLIRRSMDLLPRQYEVVTATVDEQAGEIGTLYQAAGFHYVGVMAAENARQPRKALRLGSGKLVTERAARQRYGSIREACAMLPGASREYLPYRGRYLAFRGSVKQRKAHLAAIQHRLVPYPKRALP